MPHHPHMQTCCPAGKWHQQVCIRCRFASRLHTHVVLRPWVWICCLAWNPLRCTYLRPLTSKYRSQVLLATYTAIRLICIASWNQIIMISYESRSNVRLLFALLTFLLHYISHADLQCVGWDTYWWCVMCWDVQWMLFVCTVGQNAEHDWRHFGEKWDFQCVR